MPSIADLRNSIPGLDTFTDLEVADIYARGAGVAPDLARYELGLAQPKRNTGLMGDLGTALKTGVQKLPGTAAALVDLPFAATTGATPASDVWGAIDRNTVNLDRRARDARFEYSPSYERDQQAVQEVWNENVDGKNGFVNEAMSIIRATPQLAAAYAKHPAYTLNQVVNSLPGMVAGGFAGRALMGIGGRAAAGLGEAAGGVGPVRAAIPGALERGLGAEWGGSVAAGLGEGAVAGAGNFQQSMEENRNNPNFDTMRSARMNLAGGAVTSLIGIGAGRAAKAMGLETAETAIVAGRMGGADRAMWKNVLGGAASESVLQEFPQSLSEAGFQNLGEGRDFNDSGSGPSILRQGLEGGFAGGIMGGVANLRGRRRPPATFNQKPDGSTDLLQPQEGYDLGGEMTGDYSPVPFATTEAQRLSSRQETQAQEEDLRRQLFRVNELLTRTPLGVKDASYRMGLEGEKAKIEELISQLTPGTRASYDDTNATTLPQRRLDFSGRNGPNPAGGSQGDMFGGGGGLPPRSPTDQMPLFDASNEGSGAGGQRQLPFDQRNVNLQPGESQDMFSGEMSPGTRQPVDLGPTASEFTRALTVGNLDVAHKIGAEAAHALGPKVYAEYEALVQQVRQAVTPPVDENGQPDMFRGGQSMPPAVVQRLQEIVETGGELVDEARSRKLLRQDEAQRPVTGPARKGLVTKAMGGAENVSRINKLKGEITTVLAQSMARIEQLRKSKKGGVVAQREAAKREADSINERLKDALAKRNMNKLLLLSQQAELLDTETGEQLMGEMKPEHIDTLRADALNQEAGDSKGTKKEHYVRRISALWRSGHATNDEAGTMMNYADKNDDKSRAALDILLLEKEKSIAEAATDREAKRQSAAFSREEDERMLKEEVPGPEWIKLQGEQAVLAAQWRKTHPDSKSRGPAAEEMTGEELELVKKLRKEGARNSDLYVWWALAKLINLARHEYPERAKVLAQDVATGMLDKASTADLGSRIVAQMVKTDTVRPFDVQKAKLISDVMDNDPNPTVHGLTQSTASLVADFEARMPPRGTDVSGKEDSGQAPVVSKKTGQLKGDWNILNAAASRLGYKPVTEGVRKPAGDEAEYKVMRPAVDFMLAEILQALDAYKRHQHVGDKTATEMVDLIDELESKFGPEVMEVVTRYATQGKLDRLARVRYDRPDFVVKEMNPDNALIVKRTAGLLGLLARADERVRSGESSPAALKNASNYKTLMEAWNAYRSYGVPEEGEITGRRLLNLPQFMEVLLVGTDEKIKSLFDKTLDAQKGWGTRAAAWRRDLNTIEVRFKDRKTDRIMTRFELNPARAHVQQIRVLAGLKEEKVKNAREAAELEASKLQRAQPMKSKPMSIMPVKPDAPESEQDRMKRLTDVDLKDLRAAEQRARVEAKDLRAEAKTKAKLKTIPARDAESAAKFLNQKFAWFGAGHMPSFGGSIGRGEARVRLQAIAGKLGVKKSGSIEELALRLRDQLEALGSKDIVEQSRQVRDEQRAGLRDETGVKIHQPGEQNESQNIGKDAANQKATGKPISKASVARQEHEFRSDSERREADSAAEVERLAPVVAEAKETLERLKIKPDDVSRNWLMNLISVLGEIPIEAIPVESKRRLGAKLQLLVNELAKLSEPVIDETGEVHMPLAPQEETRFSKTQISKRGGQGAGARGRATRKLIPKGTIAPPAAKVDLEAVKERAQNALDKAFTTDEVLKLADHFGTDPATAAQRFMQTYANWVRNDRRISDNLIPISGLLQKYSAAQAGKSAMSEPAPAKKELTPDAVPTQLKITLKVKVEDTGEVHDVEFNARKALAAASQKVKRLEMLADCL